MNNYSVSQGSAINDISREMVRQDFTWGPQEHDDSNWILIATEELGECAKAILEASEPSELHREVIHTAAVCAQWAACIRRRWESGVQS